MPLRSFSAALRPPVALSEPVPPQTPELPPDLLFLTAVVMGVDFGTGTGFLIRVPLNSRTRPETSISVTGRILVLSTGLLVLRLILTGLMLDVVSTGLVLVVCLKEMVL